MQQHLRRQDGVGKVDVNLVDGKVVIYPKEDARFDPVAIFKAVYDSGVSVSEMTITASGELVQDPAKGLEFKVNNSEVFELKPNNVTEHLMNTTGTGKTIKVRGLLYRKAGGKKKTPANQPMEILEVLS